VTFRNAPRSEQRFAIITVDGERIETTAASYIDRKQRIARQIAARKSLERREATLERRYERTA
jgi:hypothetical protein